MKKIGILGFGNMGQAIFYILKQQLSSSKTEFFITSRNLHGVPGVTLLPTAEDLFSCCDLIFICIKPQDFYNLKIDKLHLKKNGAIVISIMAGVTIKNIKKTIPLQKIVRSMPNLALQIQQGVIGWHAAMQDFSNSEIKSISTILDLLGDAIFLKKEKMLNSITAISGSGPAYVFLFMDALVDAAKSLGFSKDEAEKIVHRTITGSIAYSKTQKNSSLKELIKKVASKKGTTEAALEELDTELFYNKWLNATKKACQRAEELSSK